MVEQNNFAVSEFINNKKAESNFEPIKNRVRFIKICLCETFMLCFQVLKLQWEYNKMLQESLKKT